MSQEFAINFENTYPSKEELWRQIEAVPFGNNVFSKASRFVGGTLTFSQGDRYIKIETGELFNFLGFLFSITVRLNFFPPDNNMIDRSIDDTFENWEERGAHSIFLSINDNSISCRILFTRGAQHESDSELVWGEGILFEMPIPEFNKAVWNVHKEILDLMEELLDGIDGFDEYFCILQLPR